MTDDFCEDDVIVGKYPSFRTKTQGLENFFEVDSVATFTLIPNECANDF